MSIENNNNNNSTISGIDFSVFDTELEKLVNVIAELHSQQNNTFNYANKQAESFNSPEIKFNSKSTGNVNVKKNKVIKKLDLKKVREAIEVGYRIKKKNTGKKKNS